MDDTRLLLVLAGLVAAMVLFAGWMLIRIIQRQVIENRRNPRPPIETWPTRIGGLLVILSYVAYMLSLEFREVARALVPIQNVHIQFVILGIILYFGGAVATVLFLSIKKNSGSLDAIVICFVLLIPVAGILFGLINMFSSLNSDVVLVDKAIGGFVSGALLILVVPVAWAIRAGWRKLRRTGEAAGPYLRDAAVLTVQAGVSAVDNARRSPLEKKLEEIDRLHAEGKITSAEREAARTAALTR